jgi:hypothetical protein
VTPRPRGVCPLCKQTRALRRNGTVGEHLHPIERTPDGIFRVVCEGSGANPLGGVK